ncbi:MAG: IS200/IS605 family transposase [Bacteroidales bacterium]|nr:IS200/IS605 family transposase [Bacteroidales bacterium]
MSTHTQILYQIIFSTWKRQNTLDKSNRKELYKYINGILNNKKCHLYRIGGISDHIHLITHIHPTITLASLVKDIELASTENIKSNNLFSNFSGWQSGYGAFTYSFKEKDTLIEYVKNQEAHHEIKTFKEELIDLLIEHGVKYEEKFLL